MAHQHARDAALEYAKQKNVESEQLVERALCHYPPPRLWRQTLELATSGGHPRGFMPLSNYLVRGAAQCALSESLLDHYDRVRTDPTVRHFLATIAIIDGFSLEDAPELAIARLKLKVRRMLKAHGL